MDLRTFITTKDFPDSPYLSDQLLFPAVASGLNVKFVSGFVASYLVRLVRDLVGTPELEPGKVHLVFCLPGHIKGEVTLGDLISTFLRNSIDQQSEAEDFVVNLLRLIDEGGLNLSFLVADSGSNITRSSIGLLQSPGSSDAATFVDALYGDDNSPVHITTSWGDSRDVELTARLEDLVAAAFEDTWAYLTRFRLDQAIEQLRNLAGGTALANAYSKPLVAETPETTNTDISDSPDPSVEDLEIDLEKDFETLVEALDSVEDSEYFLSAFFGAGTNLKDLSWFLENRRDKLLPIRPHAQPLSPDLVSYLGDYTATCWCGLEYDRRYGCSER